MIDSFYTGLTMHVLTYNYKHGRRKNGASKVHYYSNSTSCADSTCNMELSQEVWYNYVDIAFAVCLSVFLFFLPISYILF